MIAPHVLDSSSTSGTIPSFIGVSEMLKLLGRFADDERGVSALEYGLLASAIALVILPFVNAIGSTLSTTFGSVSTALR